MGVIQNSLVGMLNTIMGGIAASKFVKGQKESNTLGRLNFEGQLDTMQDDYLQNKSGIETQIEEGNKAYETLISQQSTNEDREAAKKALTSAQQKLDVLNERNKRIETRFKEFKKQYPDSDAKLVGYEEKPIDNLSEGKGYSQANSVDKYLNKLKGGK